MKIVYIAGRYSADTFAGVAANIRVAHECALEFGKHRIAFFCPIIHTAHFDSYLGKDDPGYEFWLAMTMELLKRCDAVFALPNWRISKAATAEVGWAHANRVPVFEEFAEAVAWYERHGA